MIHKMNKSFLVSMGLCVFGGTAYAQQVTTYAGKQYTGSGNYNSVPNNNLLDDYYSIPHGIALDTNGRMYLTDQHNIIILESGISRQRGGFLGDPNQPGAIGRYRGTASVTRFATPRGVFVHPKTNSIYICDTDNSQIRSGTPFVNSSNPTAFDGLNASNPDDDNAFAGKYSFLGGYTDGTKSSAEFSSPEDIVITSNGSMYVADYGNDCIRKIAGGSVTTYAGKGLSTGSADGVGANARFYAPSGLCLESDNLLLVADRNNGKIRRINLTTAQVTTVVSGLKSPSDVVYADGLIFIADDYAIKMWDGSKLVVYAGKEGVSGYANGTDTTARFGDLGLMVYSAKEKSIYICDRENNVVRRLTITQSPVPDFVCNNVMPTVAQTVVLRSRSKFSNSLAWTITPSSYTLQAGSKLTDTAVYVSFNSTGSYTVKLVATNNTGSVPLTKTNYINVSTNSSAKPAADFVAVKTLLAWNDTAKLIDLSGNAPVSWDWTITPRKFAYTGGTDSNSRNPKLVFTASGTFTVTLKATNANGSGSATKTNYLVVAANDLPSVSTIALALYPNPVNSVLHFNGVRTDSEIYLTGMDGRTHKRTLNGRECDLSNLSSGLYIVSGFDALGNRFNQKIVKLD
jgi:PKD repeat protein/sugar lactone lactonase YvrE